MSSLDAATISFACPHTDAADVRYICAHLLNGAAQDYGKQFTGRGRDYNLLCISCFKDPEQAQASGNLRAVCTACFMKLEGEADWSWEDGIIRGQPEVLERTSALRFDHEMPAVPVDPASVLAIAPVDSATECVCIALTASGSLLRVNFARGTTASLCDLPPDGIDLSQPITFLVSQDGDFAAVANTYLSAGVVVALNTGQVIMRLVRDDYHVEHCAFPLTFFGKGAETRLVHGTAWNRLDISDPRSGTLLTERGPTAYRKDEPFPPHYLDYFHGRLVVSPNGEWIADDGWVWHPVGDVVTWNLRCWQKENVWESEDRSSRRTLCYRAYYWGGPMCWIDERTLAIWGYGDDDDYMIPAARIFDVETGEEKFWFAGPVGQERSIYSYRDDGSPVYINLAVGMFFFDKYLFTSAPGHGTSVWDATTGERLHQDSSLVPLCYHQSSRCFLSVAEDRWRLSRLVGDEDTPV